MNVEIPAGICQCGCGQPTKIAENSRYGNVVGQPLKYVKNHSPNCRRSRQAYKKEFHKKRHDDITEYLKAHPCIDCGQTNPIVLAFHHRNPDEKSGQISDLLLNAKDSTLWAEVEKCDVLCANCHLIRHAKDNWSAMKKNRIPKQRIW